MRALALAVVAATTVCACASSQSPRGADAARAFRVRWTAIAGDPSDKAARARATVYWGALSGDDRARDALAVPYDDMVSRGLADAKRASQAFSKDADGWTLLAFFLSRAGELRAASKAACRAAAIDPRLLDVGAGCSAGPGAASESGDSILPCLACKEKIAACAKLPHQSVSTCSEQYDACARECAE